MSPALTFYRGRVRQGSLTYAELLSRVKRTAAHLQKLGLDRGDRIAICSPSSLEVPVVLFAIWRMGAVAVPLNPHNTPDDWRHIVAHAGARACIVAPELREAASSLPVEHLLPIDSLSNSDGGVNHAPAPASRDDPAIILYTSGTTALPKGVVLSQRNLQTNALAMARRFGLSRSTQLAVLPLYHAHALGFGLMSTLTTGGHLVFTDKLDPLVWPELIRAESVQVTSVVPPMLSLLVSARVTQAKVPSLRALLVSSAPLDRELAREALERSSLPLVHGWGLSEFTNFACCLDAQLDAATRKKLLLDEKVPSVGPPLEGTDVIVADEAGRAVADGEEGELCVRGPSRMVGYFADAEATAATLRDDWLRTGDLGFRRIVDGKPYFHVSGRLKEIIIRGGEKYSPVAVEARLFDEVPELCGRLTVLGFRHSLHGEEVGAYLEGSTLPDGWEPKLLHAVERLPVEMRPKIILRGEVPTPRTHTGKVQRRKLQPLFEAFHDHRGPTRVVTP